MISRKYNDHADYICPGGYLRNTYSDHRTLFCFYFHTLLSVDYLHCKLKLRLFYGLERAQSIQHIFAEHLNIIWQEFRNPAGIKVKRVMVLIITFFISGGGHTQADIQAMKYCVMKCHGESRGCCGSISGERESTKPGHQREWEDCVEEAFKLKLDVRVEINQRQR